MQKVRQKVCGFLFLFCSFAGTAALPAQTPPAMPSLRLNATLESYSLGAYSMIAEDKSRSWTIEELVAGEHDASFHPSTSATPSFGFTRSAWWLKVHVFNDGLADPLILNILPAYTDYLDVYLVPDTAIAPLPQPLPQGEGSKEEGRGSKVNSSPLAGEVGRGVLAWHTGEFRPVSTRDIKSGNFVFALGDALAPGKGATLYFRLEATDSLGFYGTLETFRLYADEAPTDTLWRGLYIGALLIFVIYLLILYFARSDTAYLFFALYFFAHILYQLMNSGLGLVYVWKDNLFLHRFADYSGYLIPIFIFLFGGKYLHLKNRARLLNNILCAFLVALYVFSVLVSPGWGFKLLNIIGFPILGYYLAFLIYAIAKKWENSLTCLVIWISSVIPNTIRVLDNLDIVNMGIAAEYASEFVLLIQILLGSVFLSVNYRKEFVKMANEQAESEAQRRFLGTMNHELRMPISVMLGMNEMITRSTKDAELKRYAETSTAAGTTLIGMVNDMLDLNRISAGRFEITEAPYSTAELTQRLKETGKAFCARYGGKNIDFNVQAENLEPVLKGDVQRIRQIATNLLSNAFKYTKEGSVTRSSTSVVEPVETTSQRQAGGLDKLDHRRLFISVSDTGGGIKKEDIEKLFEPFYRVHEEKDSSPVEGAGLGLAIAKEFAAAMNGNISVKSKLGSGSVFTLELPQELASPSELPDISPEDGFLYTAPNARILVVDDSHENLQLMQLLLLRIKSRIDTASSGKEALEKVKTSAYDLIFLDYMMPGMDGLETFNAFKKITGFATPVIAFTGEAQKETRDMLMNAGFSDYLVKPVAPQDLEDAIRKRLPPELVETRGGGSGGETIPPGLEAALDKHGVSLKDALEYNNDSLELVHRTAEILVQSYDKRKGEMAELIAQGNWEGLRYLAHSLKSTLRSIGAINAADTAKRLELYCKKSVVEPVETTSAALIKNTAALLFTEWEDAINGYRINN
ncbi:MAG: response regulator [Spirochaetaceae bacterium]|jgi:signal transduction histidine kinase/CheY-like chemotaxis protein/HPt (histidine-containing phosphotransfer) domain-containing protein|nr:response regulator [Spirochaetaceae bacterium]